MLDYITLVYNIQIVSNYWHRKYIDSKETRDATLAVIF